MPHMAVNYLNNYLLHGDFWGLKQFVKSKTIHFLSLIQNPIKSDRLYQSYFLGDQKFWTKFGKNLSWRVKGK